MALNLEELYAPRREALKQEVAGPEGLFTQLRRRTMGADVASGRRGSPIAQWGASQDIAGAGQAYSSGLSSLLGQQAGQEAQMAQVEAERKWQEDMLRRQQRGSLNQALLGMAGDALGSVFGPTGAMTGQGLSSWLGSKLGG